MVRFMEASVDLILNSSRLNSQIDSVAKEFSNRIKQIGEGGTSKSSGVDLVLKGVADDTLKLKTDFEAEAKKRQILWDKLMAGPALLPPRMDGMTAGRGGAGGKGGFGSGAGAMGLVQLSYGIQDLATVTAAGGSFQQGMVAMSNNLGAMLTMAGTAAGAFAGLGITLAALALPKVIDWFRSLAGEVSHAAEKVAGLQLAFDQFGRGMSVNVNVAGFRAGLRGNLDEMIERKGGPGKQAEHGFRDFKKQMDDEERRMKVEDVKANATIQETKPEIERLEKLLLQSKQAAEYVAATTGVNALLPGRPNMPQGILKPGLNDNFENHILTPEEEKSMREQTEKLKDELKRAQDVLKEDEEKRKIIAGARKTIGRDLSAEEAKHAAEEKTRFDKHIAQKFSETEDSEFQKRRQRIKDEQAEAEKAVRESGLSPEEKDRRLGRIGALAGAQGRHVDKDEAVAQNRFLRGMEAAQKGTGSVHAVEDKLREDLDKATKLFGAGTPQEKKAQEQAFATAQAETQRIMNANRPKGGQFFGLEQFSQHLMSELQGGDPDQKAIAKATFDAATSLKTMVDQGIKVKDQFQLGAK